MTTDNTKLNIYDDICNLFNENNVMSIEDFNDICDYWNTQEEIIK